MFELRAECVGNNYLDEAHALSTGQMALLRRIGWSSLTGTRGSPNFFRDRQEGAGDLVPTLGLKREGDTAPAPPRAMPREDTGEKLRKLVLKAIREGSGNADVEEFVAMLGVESRP